MTPRQLVVAALEAGLPDVDVDPYAHGRAITSRSVLVRVDTVAPSPEAPLSHRLYTYTLLVVVPFSDATADAEDALDQLLEDVLDVIETDTVLPMWRTAQRAVYGETYLPAYAVELDVTHLKEASTTP